MKQGLARLSVATMIAGWGMAASPTSYACAADPYISSVCIMATPATGLMGGFGRTYVLAAGQTMQMQQYQALYALLANTYGVGGAGTFMLPDLRGKVVLGYDPRTPNVKVGATGGAATVNLSIAQLPPHVAQFSNTTVPITGVTATTTLSGLTATANLSGLTLTGTATGLKINAVSSNTTSIGNPDGAYLGKPGGGQGNVYTTATPNAQLNAGSITGTLSHVLGPNITAPVSFGTGGGATTALGGALALNASSATIGSGVAVPTMPPYVVMPYYIAITGMYPTAD